MTVNYQAALAKGLAAPIVPARAIGCCRVYVTFDKKDAKGVEAAAAKLGKRFQRKAHYNLANALYVGYDNCGGNELARGEAIKTAFGEVGVRAIVEYEGD